MKFQLTKEERLVTLAAAKDAGRPVIACVHLRKGIIEAANGYITVQKKVTYDGPELLLKATDLAKCRDDKSGSVTFIIGEGSEEVIASGKDKLILDRQEGQYPDIDKLYPKKVVEVEIMECLTGSPQLPFKIAMGRTNLITLLQSLDEEVVRFHFYGRKTPVQVETLGAKGIIMPMDVKWEERYKIE